MSDVTGQVSWTNGRKGHEVSMKFPDIPFRVSINDSYVTSSTAHYLAQKITFTGGSEA